jgi:hypothetical protein
MAEDNRVGVNAVTTVDDDDDDGRNDEAESTPTSLSSSSSLSSESPKKYFEKWLTFVTSTPSSYEIKSHPALRQCSLQLSLALTWRMLKSANNQNIDVNGQRI